MEVSELSHWFPPPSAETDLVADAAISPLFVGLMFSRHSWINVPFFVAGALIAYDLLLYKEFSAVRPPEER